MHTLLEAIVNGWWQGIVLTALVWLVLRDLPRVSAATRMAIWQATMLVVVFLPGLQRISLPDWRFETERPSVQQPALPATPVLQSLETPRIQTRPVVELPNQEPYEMFLALGVFLAFIQMLRLAAGYWTIRRLKKKATVLDIALPLKQERAVRILASEKIGMPVAVGYRRPAILLPSSMLEHLTEEQTRYVLLHESAHVARRDDWMALAERIIRAIFFIQPAVWFIGRQIEREREMACDDWVVAKAGETRRYAETLTRVAEIGTFKAPALATGAGRRKEIFARLETLLDKTRNRMPRVSESMMLLAVLVLLLVVYEGGKYNHLFGFDGFNNHWVENDGRHRREFKVRGDVEYTSDDRDVARMSPGSMLVYEENDGFASRRVEVEADENGNVQRRYFVDGFRRNSEEEIKRLLGNILPPMIREQGREIPQRTARLLREKGIEGTLDEIRSIRGSEVKRGYLEELLFTAKPAPEQLRRVLKVGSELGSDDEKHRLFESLSDQVAGRGLDTALLGFIDGVNADNVKMQMLVQGLERGAFPVEVMPRFYQSVGKLHSDDAKADILKHAVRQTKPWLGEAYFQVVSAMHSDDRKAQALNWAVAAQGADAATLAMVLRTGEPIASDDEKLKVLTNVARTGKAALGPEAARLLGSMHNDDQKQHGIEAILERGDVKPALLKELLLQTLAMSSDEEKSQVLTSVATRFGISADVRHGYFSVVNSMHSNELQRRVLQEVARRPGNDAETIAEIRRSAMAMHSDEDRSAVLNPLR